MSRDSPQLFMACEARQWRRARDLIERNTGVGYTDSEGFTVLHVAVKNNCPVEVAQGLIRKGIKANTKSYGGEKVTCLHLAMRQNVSAALVEYLVQAGAKINQANFFLKTPLHYVDHRNFSIQLLDTMVRLGADLNREDCNGWTPLMNAVKANSIKHIVSILKHGADPFYRNKNRIRAIDVANKDNPSLQPLLTSSAYLAVTCSPRIVPRLAGPRTSIRLIPTELQRKLREYLCA